MDRDFGNGGWWEDTELKKILSQAYVQHSYGIERDKQALGFYDLLNTANNFEKSILQQESAHLAKELFARSLTRHEMKLYQRLRKDLSLQQATIGLVTALKPEELASISPLMDRNLGSYAQGILKRELAPEEEATLRSMTEKFGPRSTLLAILSHPDSVFSDSDH